MGLIEQTIERHEAVRQLVEREHPHCRVQAIDELTRSQYGEVRERVNGRLRGTGEWMLMQTDISYEVGAASVEPDKPSIKCVVQVDDAGTLLIAKTTHVFYQL